MDQQNRSLCTEKLENSVRYVLKLPRSCTTRVQLCQNHLCCTQLSMPMQDQLIQVKGMHRKLHCNSFCSNRSCTGTRFCTCCTQIVHIYAQFVLKSYSFCTCCTEIVLILHVLYRNRTHSARVVQKSYSFYTCCTEIVLVLHVMYRNCTRSARVVQKSYSFEHILYRNDTAVLLLYWHLHVLVSLYTLLYTTCTSVSIRCSSTWMVLQLIVVRVQICMQ